MFEKLVKCLEEGLEAAKAKDAFGLFKNQIERIALVQSMSQDDDLTILQVLVIVELSERIQREVEKW